MLFLPAGPQVCRCCFCPRGPKLVGAIETVATQYIKVWCSPPPSAGASALSQPVHHRHHSWLVPFFAAAWCSHCSSASTAAAGWGRCRTAFGVITPTPPVGSPLPLRRWCHGEGHRSVPPFLSESVDWLVTSATAAAPPHRSVRHLCTARHGANRHDHVFYLKQLLTCAPYTLEKSDCTTSSA